MTNFKYPLAKVRLAYFSNSVRGGAWDSHFAMWNIVN